MKLKEIPEYTVVHTPTEEEAKELLAILYGNGWVWIEFSGEEYDITYWDRYEHRTCYNLKPGKIIDTEERDFYADEGYTILKFSKFKEMYILNEDNFAKSEDEKPQPKLTVGDKAIFPTINEPLTIHAIMGDVAYSWCDDGSVRCAAILDVLKPYTEPETKPTEDMETKENRNLSQDVANCDKYEGKDPNLCELLKGHEGEVFFSLAYGVVVLEEIRRGTQRGDSPDFLCVRATTFDSGIIIVNPNGKLRNAGVVDLVPSRELYEQYPLDPYTAWMKWQEEQKKPFICIHWGEVDCNGDEEEDYTGNTYFRTPADRDKCIEEIKVIIEKYS